MTYIPKKYSEHYIKDALCEMGMEKWIVSIVKSAIINFNLYESDFIGKTECSITVHDLITSLFYYAFKVGNHVEWEGELVSEFKRRPKNYENILNKVENFTTGKGLKKFNSIKRSVREGVEHNYKKIVKEYDSLGVFVGYSDIELLFNEKDNSKFLKILHDFGNCEQNNPRYYLHMIYRLYISELHVKLNERGVVIRYPSFQQIMDIKYPVNSFPGIPVDFRNFIKNSLGMKVPVVSLPVPSKTKYGKIVYDFNFELISWVPILRNKIHIKFHEWENSKYSECVQFYPKYLINGNPGNEKIVKIQAEIAMKRELQSKISSIGAVDDSFIEDIVERVPGIEKISEDYENHKFKTSGDNLRERLGFFMRTNVRKLFKELTKSNKNICSDIYSYLNLPEETIGKFIEYCFKEAYMVYRKNDEEDWREFLFILGKISSCFNAYSKKVEINKLIEEYGSISNYASRLIINLDA